MYHVYPDSSEFLDADLHGEYMLPTLSQGTFITQEVEDQAVGILFIRSIDMGNFDDR